MLIRARIVNYHVRVTLVSITLSELEMSETMSESTIILWMIQDYVTATLVTT